MGIATFPASASGLSTVVKSIQRGVAGSAGNITISAVDTTKTSVRSFSTSAAGTVAATGTLSGATGSTSATSTSSQSGNMSSNAFTVSFANSASTGTLSSYSPPQFNARYGYVVTPGSPTVSSTSFSFSGSVNANAMNVNGANVSLNATNLSGGSTNLTAASYGVYLQDSTTLVATGPCRYEVVEYY